MTLPLPNAFRLGWWARPGIGGATAVEYALAVPVLILLTLGIADMARLMFTQVALDRAVHAAARCAAIDAVTCGTAARTQSYAATQAYGLIMSSTAFTSAAAPCGQRVTGTFAFSFGVPGVSEVTLTASACHPVYV